MNQKIVIDGKVYNSAEEMPPDIRQQYESAKQQAGAASLFDAAPSMQPLAGNITSITKFMVNGQTYDSLDQLPPEARAKYEQAMSALDANRNGIPEFVEGILNAPDRETLDIAHNLPRTPTAHQSSPKPASATIEPESSGGWMLALAGIILVAMCLALAAAGAWYFFL